MDSADHDDISGTSRHARLSNKRESKRGPSILSRGFSPLKAISRLFNKVYPPLVMDCQENDDLTGRQGTVKSVYLARAE